jgi:hypothetical protein
MKNSAARNKQFEAGLSDYDNAAAEIGAREKK